jgi:hypothetical protein
LLNDADERAVRQSQRKITASLGRFFDFTHVSVYEQADITLDNFAIRARACHGRSQRLSAGALGLIRRPRAC